MCAAVFDLIILYCLPQEERRQLEAKWREVRAFEARLKARAKVRAKNLAAIRTQRCATPSCFFPKEQMLIAVYREGAG